MSNRISLTPQQQKVEDQICARSGLDSIEFAQSHPTLSYVELAKIVEINPPIHLIWLLAEKSFLSSQICWFVKDSLVRSLHTHCQSGWVYNEHANYETASAIGHWIGVIGYLGPEIKKKGKEALESLKQVAPRGWLPESIGDPIIQNAFSSMSFDVSSL